MGNKGFLKFLGVALVTSVLTACGGGGASYGSGSGGTTGSTGPTVPTTPVPASLKLIASSPQLPSSATTTDATGAVKLTAIVKDADNNLISGAPVTFSSKRKTSTSCGGGGAVTPGGTTNASGTATSTLTTAGDQQNQIITVTATSGSKSDSIDIPVVGTHLQVTGPSALGSGSTATYNISLRDSANVGIPNQLVQVSSCPSSPGCTAANAQNSFDATSFSTDANGQGQVKYTGTNGGADILNFTAGCATPVKMTVQVASKNLSFTTPDPSSPQLAQIPFDTPSQLVVKLQGVSPLSGQVIQFTTNRGELLADAGSSNFVAGGTAAQASVTTDASGIAIIDVKQPTGPNGVGVAIVTARTAGPAASSVGTTAQVEFVATTPAGVIVQAQQDVVQANGSSVVQAVVRDVNDNPVKDQRVDFTLVGIGSLSAAFGITDSQGTASVTYTAPSITSGQNTVSVTGAVTDGGSTFTDDAQFTVAGQALNIVLASGLKVANFHDTEDQLPYSVIVQDSAGNPVKNAVVTLKIASYSYRKGQYTYEAGGWTQNFSTANECANEDINLNGILNSGEDTNGNGILDPGGVATVPPTVTLDDTGSGFFLITYPKDYATWLAVQLTASVSVAGSEGIKSAIFPLLGIADDYAVAANIAIPGEISPYGTASDCSTAN